MKYISSIVSLADCADYYTADAQHLTPEISHIHLDIHYLPTTYLKMTTALSKRHQARNERALQELIKTVPGNDRCADCGTRNPGMPPLLRRIYGIVHADSGL